jgi:hypothetical protein
MSSNYYQRDPQDVLPVGNDWSTWLEAGETITASSWTVPAGITQTTPAPSFTTTTTTIWLTGGTLNLSYPVVNHITTNQGKQRDQTLTIAVRDR